jgi:two-component system phosphate regulon sensor histidine kinase PhoR
MKSRNRETGYMAIEGVSLLEQLQTPALVVARGQVRFANSPAKALLGAHIVGQDVRIAIRDPGAVAAILSESGGSAQVSGLSTGSSVWEVDCRVLGPNERIVSLYDLSERVSVAKSHADFVANASHELRTPLANVLGYVETLMNPKAGGDEGVRLRFLETIRHEAQRMQALISDLMSLSRIEAVKHEVPADNVDVVALAHEIAGEFRTTAAVSVIANCDDAVIAGDRGQIGQVLRNLIDNALKYGKPGGPVVVSIEAASTGWVLMAVRDEGDGIAPEHLPRVTERFYRADTSRSRAAGGTGLGLSIVKHIVERHRGRFDIDSRPGVGTTASMMLPLREGKAAG